MVMLLLTFRAAENLYAIDAARVVEVVPRINLRLLPHAPDFLAGVLITAARSCRSLTWGSCWARRAAAIGSAPGLSWSIAARPFHRELNSQAKQARLPRQTGKTRW